MILRVSIGLNCSRYIYLSWGCVRDLLVVHYGRERLSIQQDKEILARREKYLEDAKKEIDQARNDLDVRETRILQVEPLLPIARQLQELKQQYEENTSDVNAFLIQECLVDTSNPEYRILTDDLFASYVNLCE